MYLLKSNKKKVAKLHVFRAPKNSHVADVARLPFGQFFDFTHENDEERLPSSMLTCPKNRIRFSLRFEEN
jgi:hypothetical protein